MTIRNPAKSVDGDNTDPACDDDDIARWIKFREWIDVKSKLNLTKIGGDTIGVAFANGPQNSKFLTF